MRDLFIRFHLSRHVPKRCDCPHLKDGQEKTMEWLAQDCACCVHLQHTGEWNPERCQPVCARQRFPLRLYAEWELMNRVVKRGTFGVMSPMGGSIQTEYRVEEGAFKFWAKEVARIPRRRWVWLIDLVEAMHRDVEKLAEGKFMLSDEDFEDVKAIGAEVGVRVVGDAEDPDTG